MKVAIRDAYGEALVKLGERNEKVVVFEADVGSSSKSILFGRRYPQRYFNFGIAEFGMATAAAGMASEGFIPFINTFSTFMSTRCLDTINNIICHDRLNIKLCGAYSGISDSYDGATHHCSFDLAVMRAMTNMMVLSPCDALETEECVNAAAEHEGPVYLRLSRAALPVITDSGDPFRLGKARLLADGKDVAIMATGSTVCRALEAAELLKKSGCSARVVDIHTIQPIDSKMIRDCAESCRALLTVEEHGITGGLGTAVSEILTENGYPIRLKKMGLPEQTVSGGYEQLMTLYHLDGKSIAEEALKMLEQSDC